jgi:hypothetical protein
MPGIVYVAVNAPVLSVPADEYPPVPEKRIEISSPFPKPVPVIVIVIGVYAEPLLGESVILALAA